jgi:hypothetical protein
MEHEVERWKFKQKINKDIWMDGWMDGPSVKVAKISTFHWQIAQRKLHIGVLFCIDLSSFISEYVNLI